MSSGQPGPAEAGRIRIRYRRPPDREDVFVQRLVHRTDRVIVTLQDAARPGRPLRVDGQTVLQDGSPALWFTFPGAWHDIGRFHLADGTFTGFYSNVLTPVRFLDASSWETTDLFLDVWQGRDGTARLLDEDELAAALEQGWLEPAEARMARAEARRILDAIGRGEWPPRVVTDWTLERALAKLSA